MNHVMTAPYLCGLVLQNMVQSVLLWSLKKGKGQKSGNFEKLHFHNSGRFKTRKGAAIRQY